MTTAPSLLSLPEPLSHYRGMQYYTAEMMEAYAAAKVTEALEAVIDLSSMYGATIELDAAIRSLIPEQ